MLKNYLKLSLRNLAKNKGYSAINIGGLAVGMAVAMLIGLWVYDELSFDKDNGNYDRIAMVFQNQNLNEETVTWRGLPYPLADALRNEYGSDFKQVSLVNWAESILSAGDKKFSKDGIYMEPGAPAMLDLKMLEGSHSGLQEPNSIMLSEATAKALYGNTDPLNKIVVVENVAAKVTGVYAEMPANSSFAAVGFIGSWELKLALSPWIKTMDNPWGNNGFQVFVQLADHADLNTVSGKIKGLKLAHIRQNEKLANAQLFLHPMSKWHLHSEFKNGVNAGGRIEFVWMFGAIALFVLILACINFMNLSTARSEKRAKEVGIRKAIGSLRGQLVGQFLSESILVAFSSLAVALLLVVVATPYFNQLADKSLQLPWVSTWFAPVVIGFTLITGIVAGSYPAFYLSHFKPVKVLKGIHSAGRFASLPRKVLVVMQFTVSIVLIVGTIVIYRQIQFAKNREVGYNRNGLITIPLHSDDIHKHLQAFTDELKNTGAATQIAESGNPITQVWNSNGGMTWKGKAAGTSTDFPMSAVSYDYGKTVGWEVTQGRDFSRDFPSDSAAFILNESAAKFMGLKNPIGERISFNDGVAFTVVGVVKDFIMESPYAPVRPSLFRMVRGNRWGIVNIRINPAVNTRNALAKIETVFKKYSPGQPFDYQFVDEEYAKKFSDEERIGNLASVFAVLAIFISSLGLFGLASFMAEQRTKEIGIRKVLGASVRNVWQLLSSDFLILVLIACVISIPIAWYFMDNWLMKYQYRQEISWWVFILSGIGAMVITLLTVSYQAIKAALVNPVQSLKTE